MKYEVVITSKNSKTNENNGAPIGVYYKNDKTVVAHLYEGSHTYENLKNNDYFVINITAPYEIAKFVLDDGIKEDYGHIKGAPYLLNSHKIQLVKIENYKITKLNDKYGDSHLMIINGNIELEKELNPPKIGPYNRANGLIVEMAVLYSRLNIVDNETKLKLKNEMNYYFKTIKKVGSEKHIELAEKMLKE
ncbi:protein of unknown function DUF447 [Methanococcus aeolicus Nankai-3]|uniref:DUF447 family protein n=1 Tax=Methanococcus aeolicus (strain ATCC BAA-1280 / DSM 17508 / OCM 812 / Nankai-3) TaxID=419665 RepID=A6UVC8_META3|nr:DUF447 domain-containing protein [Methanococcus aeolicus]ABR56450.1 protein of unknown function DUF447 [Methanococcus aeolicus Nankai-3]